MMQVGRAIVAAAVFVAVGCWADVAGAGHDGDDGSHREGSGHVREGSGHHHEPAPLSHGDRVELIGWIDDDTLQVTAGPYKGETFTLGQIEDLDDLFGDLPPDTTYQLSGVIIEDDEGIVYLPESIGTMPSEEDEHEHALGEHHDDHHTEGSGTRSFGGFQEGS